MTTAIIEIDGAAIRRSANGVEAAPLALAPALAQLATWADRYERAILADRDDDLGRIGREMFAWLDQDGWASDWEGGLGDLELEIRASARERAEDAIFIDAPWELLSNTHGFLAMEPIRLFAVARRTGPTAPPPQSNHSDIRMMFMAAAPEGPSPLAYESEETAILEATSGGRNLHLVVEETGTLSELGRQLAAGTSPFEIVHISSHGDVEEHGPYLLLESEEGQPHRVYAPDLVDAFGPAPPLLLMLSACRTAERELATPFARQLALVVPNVVGWGGSVFDGDAILFAARFYAELGRRSPVARAAAFGRRDLLRRRGLDLTAGRHWHLPRVYIGPGGGGSLCAGDMPARLVAVDGGPRAFLDKERQRIPVASQDAFVGRRRALQAILRALRTHQPGILIHGMGAIGKSSIAARVASRLPLKPCIVFEHYDASAVCDALIDALPPIDRRAARDDWRAAIAADPEVLGDALEAWLEGAFNAAPILLIIDDLEQILTNPKPGDNATAVKPDFQAMLGAVLKAFSNARTASRLLMTSRYDMTLPDRQGRDLARYLTRIPLTPMPPVERLKQLRSAQRIAADRAVAIDDRAADLIDRCLMAAGGNPGLQAVLTGPVILGELDLADAALSQIETYYRTGAPASEVQALIDAGVAKDHQNAMVAFFARLSFATYRAALGKQETRFLSAATLFTDQLPIPVSAMLQVGDANGCSAAQKALDRAIGLGLIDDWGPLPVTRHVSLNTLARPLVPALSAWSRFRLARKVMPCLLEEWREWANERLVVRTDPRAVEALTLALAGRVDPAIVEETATAAAAWFERHMRRTKDAFDVVMTAHAYLPRRHRCDAQFIRIGVECAHRLGEVDAFGALTQRQRQAPRDTRSDQIADAQLTLRLAEYLTKDGKLDEAEAMLAQVIATSRRLDDEATVLFAQSRLSSVHYQRGDYDEVLRINQTILLPRYEARDDGMGKADALAEIARIHLRRGDLDQSMRMQREEILPIYRRLGDERSCAVTMGAIADVLEKQGGNHVEVLRIRREEELAVYERLGAMREMVHVLDEIANISEVTGDLEEAARVRRDEVIPAYERLGDRSSLAVAKGQLARVLAQLDREAEALKIREEEELPMYLEHGDVRMTAICRMELASLLWKVGREDEALDMLKNQCLPTFEKLGEVRAIISANGRLSRFLIRRGEVAEALALLRNRVLPLCDQQGDPRQKGIMLGILADAVFESGDHAEAIRIAREEQLPLYERVGDKRSYDITVSNIAFMREEMGAA